MQHLDISAAVAEEVGRRLGVPIILELFDDRVLAVLPFFPEDDQ